MIFGKMFQNLPDFPNVDLNFIFRFHKPNGFIAEISDAGRRFKSRTMCGCECLGGLTL